MPAPLPQEDGSSEIVTFHQVRYRTLEADLSLLHEHRPFGDGGSYVERLLDDDHRDALSLEPLNDLNELLDHDWRQA